MTTKIEGSEAGSVVSWIPVAGSPDYTSTDGAWIAVYKQTSACGRGANYWVFCNVPGPRRMRDAVSVGGLPARLRG